MRQLIQLQQQVLSNNARMVAGPAGPAVARAPSGPGSVWGRSGFSPNASFMDRAQFRAVNEAERAFAMGALDLDLARTQLRMLSTPRRDPNNPDNLLPGVIRPEVVAQIEAEAHGLTQQFRALNRAHILDTFRELVTNFQDAGTDAAAAFRLLPLMLHTQEWQILQGDTVPQAREGMLRLMRAMGLASRLVDSQGNLQINQATGRPEAELFIENYLRARMMGGRDVSPDQVHQVMKYMKTAGQAISPEAMLLAFIGMPDIRGSSFGHQLFMMMRQLTGRATQANQRALEAAGLGTITAREGSGPHSFQANEPQLLHDNPFMWFHKYILEGYLRRQRGIDWMNAPAPEIAAALDPLFGNMSASNMAQTFAQQLPEWLTMARNASRANLSDEARQALGSGSTWFQLQAARSRLQEVMASVAELQGPVADP